MGGPEQETHYMDTSMFEPFNGKKTPTKTRLWAWRTWAAISVRPSPDECAEPESGPAANQLIERRWRWGWRWGI